MEDTNTAIAALEIPTVTLPDLGLPATALAGETDRLTLLTAWLEAWQTHRAGQPFALQGFLDAAQSRLAELYPDDELELGVAAYDQIKDWVFDALGKNQLTQDFDTPSKRITLKAPQA